ncbi:MAG: type II toxin-antitoxin system VapC family toxin [Verrucomicrobia bacterium]|nr:type II toxin-antitoxin system VapC family toxin [Verrucomicrobiota bacterium]
MSRRTVFLDSAYLIALAVEQDASHPAAKRWAKKTEAETWSFLTTWAVMLEMGNALAKPQYREMAVSILNGFQEDPTITVVPLNESLLHRAITLFTERPDKGWSLTDCISFLVMEDADLLDALTTDVHFEQAGFRALLRN